MRALAGATGPLEPVAEFLLSAMSQRMAATLREEVAALGKVREAVPGIRVDLGPFAFESLAGVDAVAGTITGVAGRDPASPFNLSVPINIEEAEVDGLELVIQHNFWDSGFGVIANATLVNGDVGYDNLRCDQPNCNLSTQFTITGLSDSANLVGYYEKNAIGVRLAYNWRDDFLAARFDGNGLPNPVYTEEFGQLDALVSYTFDNGWTLFAEGFNLTDEYLRSYGRTLLQTQYVTQLGPRYGIGVRWTY